VRGESFAKTTRRAREPGPALTGMWSHHHAEYFPESIVNPNSVIVQGAGYTGPDGLSKMPDYSEELTVRQLLDLVSYLKSLKSDMPPQHAGDKPASDWPMEMKGHDMK
jgi:hypothetical protein